MNEYKKNVTSECGKYTSKSFERRLFCRRLRRSPLFVVVGKFEFRTNQFSHFHFFRHLVRVGFYFPPCGARQTHSLRYMIFGRSSSSRHIHSNRNNTRRVYSESRWMWFSRTRNVHQFKHTFLAIGAGDACRDERIGKTPFRPFCLLCFCLKFRLKLRKLIYEKICGARVLSTNHHKIDFASFPLENEICYFKGNYRETDFSEADCRAKNKWSKLYECCASMVFSVTHAGPFCRHNKIIQPNQAQKAIKANPTRK